MTLDEDALLRRSPFAQALTEAGFPIKPSTLATKATRGGGPPYELWGRIPLYRWGPGLKWARAELRHPRATRPKPVRQRHPCGSPLPRPSRYAP